VIVGREGKRKNCRLSELRERGVVEYCGKQTSIMSDTPEAEVTHLCWSTLIHSLLLR
jgi:hypothetical protein